MGFCNSCGRPILKDDCGTNSDGSINLDYCDECYMNGEFTEPNITLNEMIIKCAEKMMNKNPRLQEEQATGIVMGFLPGLKRWYTEESYDEN
ncbi:zinc ribbon domain-containing protein [Methanobrevibacter sp. DSM 116169]|uniref:zinc ribbon domain-containing protein n=1 Tax=Methanobrevibacter sp. DSM 116169 TaxID=3242727 RepID=UPI0038FC30E1